MSVPRNVQGSAPKSVETQAASVVRRTLHWLPGDTRTTPKMLQIALGCLAFVVSDKPTMQIVKHFWQSLPPWLPPEKLRSMRSVSTYRLTDCR